MGTRVYVGGLPRDATTREIQDGFSRYGHVANIWIARNPPGFAFVVSSRPRSLPSFCMAPARALAA